MLSLHKDVETSHWKRGRDEVYKAIIQELNPQLSITLSGYEKLIDQLGKEETIDFFKEEIIILQSRKND